MCSQYPQLCHLISYVFDEWLFLGNLSVMSPDLYSLILQVIGEFMKNIEALEIKRNLKTIGL